jgi:Kef-type K+ transport system membrane component KefB
MSSEIRRLCTLNQGVVREKDRRMGSKDNAATRRLLLAFILVFFLLATFWNLSSTFGAFIFGVLSARLEAQRLHQLKRPSRNVETAPHSSTDKPRPSIT